MSSTPSDPDASAASALMKRGIALLNENTPASLSESLEHFSRAIEIRRALLTPEDDWMGYVLAASWMNRADALTRLGGAGQLVEALRCYDEALAVLAEIPTGENALYRRRLAVAWINRGLTLHQQETPASFAEAVECFDRGIEQLQSIPDQSISLAAAWVNRANTLLRLEPPSTGEASRSADIAISALGIAEQSDLLAAETGLKARHILCQAIACDLPSDSAPAQSGTVAPALQTAADGLRLARHWAANGETRFANLATGLFKFGVLAHQRFAPEKLVDFIGEHLPADTIDEKSAADLEKRATAVAALTEAWRDQLRDGFAPVNSPAFHQLLTTLQSLRGNETPLVTS